VGFLDKVKEQATAATAAAKDAAQKGQAKLDVMQAKKAADAMFRDLGVAAYAQSTGRGTPQTDDDINRLVEGLKNHEQVNGPVSLALESPIGLGAQAVHPDGPPSAESAAAAAPPAGAPVAPPPTAQPMAPPPVAEAMAPPAGAPMPPPSGQTL
jgi:hypothetical protein